MPLRWVPRGSEGRKWGLAVGQRGKGEEGRARPARLGPQRVGPGEGVGRVRGKAWSRGRNGGWASA